ncbi:alpha/beta fold hydrolase [Micrococcus sp. TA1]|uniref:alpha/beta fold hydrolase n=1 Tax=Micrococcus sp. TA1 TaxID=681627 RepID=UPI0016123318|nr:alpha/beta fold hydrolase [Micrococcus sp. TA1]MBB5750135.1 pimeloyl-ACP methyl ester carboxylesterase [Micrococcus sp. TA1]
MPDETLVPPGATVTEVNGLRALRAGTDTGRVPLVLVHGGGADHSGLSWYAAMGPLSRDRLVWAVDLPGFGGSIDVPPVGGPGQLARVVLNAMDAAGLPRAVVIGVSMGGDVSLNVALQAPSRVAGLVLVGPGGLIPVLRNASTQRWAWRAARLPDWLLVPMARVANRFASRVLRTMVRDPAVLPVEVVREFIAHSRHPRSGLAYGRYNQATLGREGMLNNLTPRLGEVVAPTLFFHGAEDRLVDPAGSVHAAAMMPHARAVIVPRCGHWAQLEAPERFLGEVRAFLGHLEEPPGRPGA